MRKLKLLFVALFIALFAFSCGPSEGDIYENLLSRERIEILSIGDCREIEESFNRINNALEKSSDQSRWDLVKAGIYRPVINFEEDAPEGSKCFAYEQHVRTRSGGRIVEGNVINIYSLSKLKEGYEKIN